MSIRINRVYTRAGDGGDTSLVGGDRVPKDSARVEAYGALDELNSFVGHALDGWPDSESTTEDLRPLAEHLLWIQNKLFDVGAYLATPPHAWREGMPSAEAADVTRLERAMDDWHRQLPELKSFVLPTGGSRYHLCRAICRRAEIEVLKVHRESPIRPEVLAFLNRLSDFFFVAARHAARLSGEEEVLWKPTSTKPAAASESGPGAGSSEKA